MSVARTILLQQPGASVTVLDKAGELGEHQSGRNSGVIHSTINYRTGSLKATLVRRGRRLLLELCAEHGVPVEVTGKWIAAIDEPECRRLDELALRGRENGEQGVTIVGASELREREPNLRAVAALWVPSTAVVDYREVLRVLADGVRTSGGAVSLHAAVTAIDRRAGGSVVVSSTAGEVPADHVVIAAGLQSDRLCGLAGLVPTARIIPFAGYYDEIVGASAGLLRETVYPVPSARLPFLGVHFTRTIDQRWTVGPSALLLVRREPYAAPLRRAGPDLASTLGYSGSWRLFGRYWRDGLRELDHHVRRRARLEEMHRYVPDLAAADLVPARTRLGVRAQAVDPRGLLVDDFLFAGDGAVTAVINAPSPAATACLAIAQEVVRRALGAGAPQPHEGAR